MSLRKLVLLALVAVFAGGCPRRSTVSVPDADIVVARDGSGDHSSIQAAINAAGPGDVIFVKSGTYREALAIEGADGIRLIGAGPGASVIDADGEYSGLTLAADGCHVEGFTITGAASHGVYVKGAGHRVRRCLIIGNGDRGVYFSSFSDRPSARIEHCTVADNGVSGIYIPAGNTETAITDCIVAFNGRGIVSDGDGNGMEIARNCVFETGAGFDRIATGDDNIEADPRFVARDDGDYRLSKASPCVGTAAGGANTGCF